MKVFFHANVQRFRTRGKRQGVPPAANLQAFPSAWRPTIATMAAP